MSEMVDRLAQAMVAFLITKDESTPPWEQADEEMRDAMREAVRHQLAAMRVPTAEMVFAARRSAPYDRDAEETWPIMIDEALK